VPQLEIKVLDEIVLSYGRRTNAVSRNTVELHLSGRWLSGSARRIGLICREFYKTSWPWRYRLSD